MAGFGSVGGFTKAAPAAKPVGARLSGLRPAKPPGPVGASFTQTSAVAKPQVPPPSPAKPVASATTTPPASPLDSTYYGNLAANQLKVGNQINSLTAQGQNLNTSLQAALAQLAYQQPRDQLKVEQAANRRGALYSSVEGQQQGDLLNQYTTKQSGLTSANAQKQAAIQAQIAGLQQGVPLYQQGQYDAAVARAIKAAAANPATGQAPITTPAPAAPAAKPAAKAKVPAGYKIGQGIPRVKSGFGYRGGF